MRNAPGPSTRETPRRPSTRARKNCVKQLDPLSSVPRKVMVCPWHGPPPVSGPQARKLCAPADGVLVEPGLSVTWPDVLAGVPPHWHTRPPPELALPAAPAPVGASSQSAATATAADAANQALELDRRFELVIVISCLLIRTDRLVGMYRSTGSLARRLSPIPTLSG